MFTYFCPLVGNIKPFGHARSFYESSANLINEFIYYLYILKSLNCVAVTLWFYWD